MQVERRYSPAFCAVTKAPDIEKKLGNKCGIVIDSVIGQRDTLIKDNFPLKDIFESQEVKITSEDFNSESRLCVIIRPPEREKKDLIIRGKQIKIFGKPIKINSEMTQEQELHQAVSCTLKGVDPQNISEENVIETIYRAYEMYKKHITEILSKSMVNNLKGKDTSHR